MERDLVLDLVRAAATVGGALPREVLELGRHAALLVDAGNRLTMARNSTVSVHDTNSTLAHFNQHSRKTKRIRFADGQNRRAHYFPRTTSRNHPRSTPATQPMGAPHPFRAPARGK